MQDDEAVRRRAREIVAAFDRAELDVDGSATAWGYSGGRDLARLEDDARLVGEAILRNV